MSCQKRKYFVEEEEKTWMLPPISSPSSLPTGLIIKKAFSIKQKKIGVPFIFHMPPW